MNKKPNLSDKGKEIEYFQEKKNNQIKSFRDQTEFQILVSQAANLAQADVSLENFALDGKTTAQDYMITLEKRFDFWFDFLLRKRTDPKLIQEFEEYLWIKNNKEEVRQDKIDKHSEAAEQDFNAEFMKELKPEEI